MEQLGDARVDKHEDGRRRKKQEIVESFKRQFAGVFDRMINMCQPIHKRYNVAITKVLGKVGYSFLGYIIFDQLLNYVYGLSPLRICMERLMQNQETEKTIISYSKRSPANTL